MNITINHMGKASWLKAIMIAMIIALAGAFMAPWSAKTADAAIADGTYEIDYTVYANGTNNPSYMDDVEYSQKPAVLTVSGGKATVEVTLNHSSWIKSLKTQQNGSYVAASAVKSGDTVTYKFPVSNLSTKVNAQIHVVVPAEIAGQPYDHTYNVQYLFDESSI